MANQPVELPVFSGGMPRVDIDDRTAILDVLYNEVDIQEA